MHVLRTIALAAAAVVVNRAAVETLRVTRLAPARSASAAVRQATFVEPPHPGKSLDVRATLVVIARGFLVIGPVPSLSSVFGLLEVSRLTRSAATYRSRSSLTMLLCALGETGESGNLLINRLDQPVGYVDGLSRGARKNHLIVLEALLRVAADPIPLAITSLVASSSYSPLSPPPHPVASASTSSAPAPPSVHLEVVLTTKPPPFWVPAYPAWTDGRKTGTSGAVQPRGAVGGRESLRAGEIVRCTR